MARHSRQQTSRSSARRDRPASRPGSAAPHGKPEASLPFTVSRYDAIALVVLLLLALAVAGFSMWVILHPHMPATHGRP